MNTQSRRWYQIRATVSQAGNGISIYIHGDIGGDGVTAKQFVQELDQAAAGASSVLVSVNSPGGEVFDAIAIYNALRRYRGLVTAKVDGIAASAASVILMAADRVIMPENAMIMIHNPWVVTVGEAEDLRKTAGMMDKIRSTLVNAYAAKTGRPDEEIIRMMDETTWMDAHQATEMGFCDEVEDPVNLTASPDTINTLAKYQGVPSSLLASLRRGSVAQPHPSRAQSSLIKVVMAQCAEHDITHLAEAVLNSEGMVDAESAKARVKAAADINAMCIVANMSDKAYDFVYSGLKVEHVRSRIMNAMADRSDAIEISNLQRGGDIDGASTLRESDRFAKDLYAKRNQRT